MRPHLLRRLLHLVKGSLQSELHRSLLLLHCGLQAGLLVAEALLLVANVIIDPRPGHQRWATAAAAQWARTRGGTGRRPEEGARLTTAVAAPTADAIVDRLISFCLGLSP